MTACIQALQRRAVHINEKTACHLPVGTPREGFRGLRTEPRLPYLIRGFPSVPPEPHLRVRDRDRRLQTSVIGNTLRFRREAKKTIAQA